MSAGLDQVTDFPALVEYLRDELEWPIAEADFEALTFDYKPEEVGLDSAKVGGGIEIRQLRPLSRKQPWGIFFVNLPKKHLSITILRTLLGSLAPKKRASSNPAERAVFDQRDLMFIANTGEAGHRHIDFAHFRAPVEGERAAPLQVLGWDADDTERRMRLTGSVLQEKLHWPEPDESIDDWRARWTDAFREPPRYAVKQSKTLAEEMAKLAKRIRARVIELIEVETDKGPLRRLYAGFKEALIHDLTPEMFADYYAQTITYGLFSARVSRPSMGFGHDSIHLNVTGTSPFLKEMLAQFLEAGGRKKGSGDDALDFDALGVGDVIELLEAADMDSVLADWDHRNQDEDPVVHFYQDFLNLYDPGERKRRGVFYTPRPVVSFIVRSVDDALRAEFGLEDGLASTVTWGGLAALKPDIKLPRGVKETDPFVRILDPATGTGTFLVECVDLIHETMLAKWKAAGKNGAEIKMLWNDYVPKHLLPRLTGFELMMAPYAIAHVKLGLKLADTGYTFGSDARAQIYLTNALEPAQDLDLQLAFMSEALAHEAKAANAAKETDFTVVIGNPPYSGISKNMGAWIQDLLKGKGVRDDLRRNYFEVGGSPLGEKKVWLQDDYVKFIRIGQLQIDRSGAGIMAMITNNGFVDNTTFRGMRESLLSTFQDIRIVDLHGSSRKGETNDNEENVFEIEQGVAISLLIRSGGPRSVFHADVYGTRKRKYEQLDANAIDLRPLNVDAPAFLFEPPPLEVDDLYQSCPPISRVMQTNGSGIITARDGLAIHFSPQEAQTAYQRFSDLSVPDNVVRQEFDIGDNYAWKVKDARQIAARQASSFRVDKIRYRPFDDRTIIDLDNIVFRPKRDLMQHLSGGQLGLMTTRQTQDVWDVKASSSLVAHKALSAYDITSAFPLWLKPHGTETRSLPNIDSAFAKRIAQLTGLKWDDCVEGPAQGALGGIVQPKPEQTAMFANGRDRGEPGKSFGPRDVFDYIYAVLHSPAYRDRYADYLKSDFARVPLPSSRSLFEELVSLGSELVALHLLDADTLSAIKDPKSIRLAGSGEPRVAKKPVYDPKLGRVTINPNRWFETVPEIAWDFHVGGYQPAQKWLKDRAAKGGKKSSPGRVLTDEEILHYRRMIAALTRTAELMPRIDQIIEKHGGWPDAFRGILDDAQVKAAE